MYAKLTYFLPFMICAAFMGSSCSSDRDDSPGIGKGSEISFAVGDMTRASDSPSFTSFALYGDKKFTAGSPAVIFNKTVVEYKDGKWRYDGTQYWMPGHEHSFVAVSPVSALQTDDRPQYQDSRLSFTYIIPTLDDGRMASHRDAEDIIAATHRRLYNDGEANTTTTLRFGHVMAQINLASALDDNSMDDSEYVMIHSLDLAGFKTKASFEILPAPRQSNGQTDDCMIEVTPLDTEGKVTIEFKEPVKVENTRRHHTILAANEAIIMLPQSFPAASDARIIISYSINDENGLHQASLPLASQKWEAGKSYNYKFTINRRGVIPEDTSISDWEVVSVGEIGAH